MVVIVQAIVMASSFVVILKALVLRLASVCEMWPTDCEMCFACLL